MFAVLEDALRILVCSDANDVGRRVAETRDWVLRDDTEWPFSFRNLCDALDIDADILRRRLGSWLPPRDWQRTETGLDDAHESGFAFKNLTPRDRDWMLSDDLDISCGPYNTID